MEPCDHIQLIASNVKSQNTCMQKVCYGFGHVYNDLCAAIWFSYTLFYFQIVLEMEATAAGSLIMLGQVADSLATPVSGWAIDRTGHPKAWHLAGTASVALGFCLIFSINPNPSLWWYFVYFGALVIFFQIGWAIVQISHLSVIPVLANDHIYSSGLTTIRYSATVLSNITVYLVTWAILDYNDKPKKVGPDDFVKFRKLVLITTGIGLLSSLIFYVGVQWNKVPNENLIQNDFHKATIVPNGIQSNSNLLKSYIVYLVALMYTSSRLYTILNLVYIPFYLEERSNADARETSTVRSAIAVVPLVSFCASFLESIVLNYKPQSISDKMIYLTGSAISLCGSVCIAIGIPFGSYHLVYAVVCLTGLGSSATMVSSLCLTARFVKVNGFQGASVYSIVTFTDKLISGAVVFVIQYLQCNPKELCPNYYKHVLAYACSLAAILGIISLILLHYRKLDINKT